MTASTTSHSVRCANNKRTRVVISCSICAVAQRNRIRHGTPAWVSGPSCLDSSARLLNHKRGSPPSLRFRKTSCRSVQWNPPSHDSSELERRDGGTVLSSPRGQRRWLEHWQRGDRKKAERIKELQEKLCQTFQTEAAIDFACDQERVLREHFPQVARSHREGDKTT